MIESKNKNRIWLFVILAFGLSWAIALIIYSRGGLAGSREIAPGISEAFLLVSFGYMLAPAVAHVLTRLLTGEGWRGMALRPHLGRNRRWWLVAWLGTAALLLTGLGVYFLVFPGNFDASFSLTRELLAEVETRTGQPAPFSPAVFLIVQFFQALLLAPLLNLVNIFGEEFGWRGYLQPKLIPLGFPKAMLWMGLIWGLWHWPLVAMGHAYGLEYRGAPWLGMLTFTWFIFVTGTFFGWLAMRSRSIWPAVIAHATLNGLAPIAAFLVQGDPNPLLGPSAAGLVGGIGLTAAALWLFLRTQVPASEPALASPTAS